MEGEGPEAEARVDHGDMDPLHATAGLHHSWRERRAVTPERKQGLAQTYFSQSRGRDESEDLNPKSKPHTNTAPAQRVCPAGGGTGAKAGHRHTVC